MNKIMNKWNRILPAAVVLLLILAAPVKIRAEEPIGEKNSPKVTAQIPFQAEAGLTVELTGEEGPLPKKARITSDGGDTRYFEIDFTEQEVRKDPYYYQMTCAGTVCNVEIYVCRSGESLCAQVILHDPAKPGKIDLALFRNPPQDIPSKTTPPKTGDPFTVTAWTWSGAASGVLLLGLGAGAAISRKRRKRQEAQQDEK